MPAPNAINSRVNAADATAPAAIAAQEMADVSYARKLVTA